MLARASHLASWRYFDQVALSWRPSSVEVGDNTLRSFARYLVTHDPGVRGFVEVEREHVEDFKAWSARHPAAKGTPPARNTVRQRLGMLRGFFERIIEWGWDDAPGQTPIFAFDVPWPPNRCPASSTTPSPPSVAHAEAWVPRRRCPSSEAGGDNDEGPARRRGLRSVDQ